MTEKLKMEQNPLSVAVEKIKEICPAAVTRDGKIDFEELKTSLATDVAEDTIEKYEFTWVGKNAAKAEANRPIRKTLRPVVADSKDWDNTKNLYIEGDNLDALKLLQESYLGKVKMIYIDPPYNTGNDFVYCDNFKMGCAEFIEKSGQCDADGNRLFANTKTNGRFHSDWCSMMYPRLKNARDLLSDDGVIFISIDDNEQANLKKICDEVFGANNFVVEMVNITGASQNGEGVKIQKNTESCLVYARNYDLFNPNKVDKADESLRNLNDAPSPLSTRPDMGYTVYYNPTNKDVIPVKDYNKDKISTNKEEEVYKDDTNLIKQGYLPIRPGYKNNLLHRWRWGFDSFVERKKEIIIQKSGGKYACFFKQAGYNPPKNILNYIAGTSVIKELFDGNRIFDFPKSTKMLEYLVNIGTAPDSIILDFFSGSATTAHAVMQLNAEDGGNRRFIMVQLPEETDPKSEAAKAGYTNICEIGKERIRRAGEKIKAENPGKDLDIGFRVLRVDSDNMADIAKRPSDITQGQLKLDVENIIPERSDLDLLFGVMVDCGLMLDMPIETKQMDDKTYYVVNHGDLVACFEKNIPEKLIYEIARMNPVCAVFRDSSFAEPKDKINLAEIFKNITGNDKCVKVL